MNKTTKGGQNKELKIRRAKSADAAQIASLTGQLGYPATTAQIRERLRRIQPASQNAVLVADAANHGVIGWLHVSKEPLFTESLFNMNAAFTTGSRERRLTHGDIPLGR